MNFEQFINITLKEIVMSQKTDVDRAIDKIEDARWLLEDMGIGYGKGIDVILMDAIAILKGQSEEE